MEGRGLDEIGKEEINSSDIAEWRKKKESGADERRWMDGYVRKRDRWGATE